MGVDGADIILTNTYQASVEGFVEYLDLDEDHSIELIKTTVGFAHLAKEQYLSECFERNVELEDGKCTITC